MVSSCSKKRLWQCLASLILLSYASASLASQRFIVGSKVRRGENVAEVSIQFACAVEYIDHLPIGKTDRLRIQIQSTTICNGVSPGVVATREQHRPLGADQAKLLDISYDGELGAGQLLTLAFSEPVSFEIVHRGATNDMVVRVYINKIEESPAPRSGSAAVRVRKEPKPSTEYVVNLSSSRRPHVQSDSVIRNLSPGLTVFETEVDLAGVTWYRLRVGSFVTSKDAQTALAGLQDEFPTAWIDRASGNDVEMSNGRGVGTESSTTNEMSAALGLDQVDQLMMDARRAMIAGEVSQAVQIYTKIIRVPGHDRHAQAQEYLALAREKKGQTAHAKAEYLRYLSLFPDGEGAIRVQQRLATLLATDRQAAAPEGVMGQAVSNRRTRGQSDWRIQTFFSQYYRRDVNQLNKEKEIVSQSALFSDVNLDARRRGKRFDFSSRLTAGYRSDFLGGDKGSGNEVRVSYAYADLTDVRTELSARVGRQSRNTGGVLGRFDGVSLSYQATERILLNTVSGFPVNSAADGIDTERVFHGLSVNFSPPVDGLELGAYYVAQEIHGTRDRQAVGSEFRYFGEELNIWGLVDFDASYKKLGSAFLQGSWRVTSHLAAYGSIDRRHSPYLSTRNSMIGQPVETFSELQVLLTEAEIHQLSIDRAPLTTSFTIGMSQSFSPKLQISIDANQTLVDATPASGGVAATPKSSYMYFSTTFVVSSIIKEGDVSMIALRVSDSDTAQVMSLTLDSRFPIRSAWRINPRLRIDRRRILSDSTNEWLITPALRMQIRRSQKYRIELEAGKRFSRRKTNTINLDRDSYYINLGYQAFF